MSYLHAPRLVFSGDFRSDVSTVNNDPAHYNNDTFQPSFQKPGSGSTNGWWNPEGGAVFNFQHCKVQQIALPDGSILSNPADDIVIGQLVGSPDDHATGKMVDLDPQEQGSSELWCVKLRIYTGRNELLLQGDIKPTGFRDLQMRQYAGSDVNRQPMGGTWTSVLTNIVWGESGARSPFLRYLRSVTQGNKLSINLNAYGYYYNHAPDGRFSLGRIIGSIGPWFENEPEFFAPARRLFGTFVSKAGGRDSIYFSNSNFLVEKENKRVTIDFGSSFPIANALGAITDSAKYILAVVKYPIDIPPQSQPFIIGSHSFIPVGSLNYQAGPDWLNKTGGIVMFNDIPDTTMDQLAGKQLVLLVPYSANPGQYMVIARESINGLVVRADNFVQRLNYQQTSLVKFYAYQWGRPLAHTNIAISMQPPTPVTPVGPENPICEIPGNNYPRNGISFPSLITTDYNGCAQLPITGNAIHSPRGYIDGQIYTLDYQLQHQGDDPAEGQFSNDNIFIHLRDYFEVPENPTWWDIAPIMIQFGNLYPIMSKYLVDLGDPVALKSKKDILIYSFTRDIHDAFHMPVTRDLSEAKRKAIIKWLKAVHLGNEEELKVAQKSLANNPVIEPAIEKEGISFTNKQHRLKDAVKAKNGSLLSFTDAQNPFSGL